ncbi:DUF2599 domain-containing protein [Parafrankia elaeagni]|uniref:DUF2599 domain-containing protein n=1 Tax=Parafrankia elaeagni TaxID=222534 RepID=UPI00039D1819|nr:DUF2599 domain-containing protein [Parafrankia elaeagni]
MTERRRSRGVLIGGVALLAAAAIAVGNDGDSDSAGDTGSPSDLAAVAPTPTAPAGPGDATGGDAGSGSGSGGSGPEGGPSAQQGAPAAPDGADSADSAAPSAPFCGASRYIEEITVQEWAGGDFRISVWPRDEARHADDRDAASAEIWAAVRTCVGTPDQAVAESLQDQLRCHEFLALVPGSGSEEYATGDTFDVESWRPTPGRRRWLSTRCGNTLGTDPTSAPVRTYRPDGVPPRSAPTGEHA